MSTEAFKALVGRAQSTLSMIALDLKDAANLRVPPDGDDGLNTALSRLADLRRDIDEAKAYAKRQGIRASPVRMAPRHDVRSDDILW